MKQWKLLLIFTLIAALLLGCDVVLMPLESTGPVTIGEIPEYSGAPYVLVNGGEPGFLAEDLTTDSYEYYSDLDELGRCGMTMACIGQDLMPTEPRGSISSVKPTGWVNNPYEFVDGEYLYNRCHLIGFQLTGENANRENLITGTRYLNVQGMLPFENQVADYIKETGNHVLYRVIPIFEGDNLLASGVTMEAWSVEDEGESICFFVYCYNVQPGVVIDYETGENWPEESQDTGETQTYILNTSSKKFHLPGCSGAENMNPKNRQECETTRELLVAQGYTPCGTCDP